MVVGDVFSVHIISNFYWFNNLKITMSNIQKALDALQPYVIGIRYLDGTVLVDVVFKEGWSVPEDPQINKAKGDEAMNYYMLFSESPNIGLDEILAYVERTIKLNLEREKKHELLREKVNELKELFKKNSLEKLNRLKFTFKEEDLVPNLNDFDIDIDDDLTPTPYPVETHEEPFEEEVIEEPIQPIDTNHVAYLDKDGNPIELTDDEKELLEEEARAERNMKMLQAKKQSQSSNKKINKVELPPKPQPKLEMVTTEYNTDCDCGPNDACDKCIDSKDF
jgi:hypothetical protein